MAHPPGGHPTGDPEKPAREHVYRPPIDEERLRNQRVYYAYRGKEEAEKQMWFPGNIFHVKLGDELLSEAQVVLVEAVKVEDLTVYDALLTGFQSAEELKEAVVSWLGFQGNVEKQGFYKVLFRWI